MTKEPTFLACYIIHLERARERFPQVQALCGLLPFETAVVTAIDGAEASSDKAPSSVLIISGMLSRSIGRPVLPSNINFLESADTGGNNWNTASHCVEGVS